MFLRWIEKVKVIEITFQARDRSFKLENESREKLKTDLRQKRYCKINKDLRFTKVAQFLDINYLKSFIRCRTLSNQLKNQLGAK